MPYNESQEQEVIQSFKTTEEDLLTLGPVLASWRERSHVYCKNHRRITPTGSVSSVTEEANLSDERQPVMDVIREARILLSRLFANFDVQNIKPRHGPGIVSTKEQYEDKFLWSNVSPRITAVFPFDAYFTASLGHVCDEYHGFQAVTMLDHSAQVILVPKDSRGPRLISCEPVDFQWIQQGLSRALVDLIEHHPLTRDNVRFTDQSVNRRFARRGSVYGEYATLDLKEASDRVHCELVRLLFPEHIFCALMAARSNSTTLPSGECLNLNKYAPMGSALCFPVMALTIWSLLAAYAPDNDVRKNIHVYGDDVIVPTGYAGQAMNVLECFGLKINRDKSCFQGFFRESCGLEAYKGVEVTPVRIRTVWTSRQSPSAYASWISYYNQFLERSMPLVAGVIKDALEELYGSIPGPELQDSAPCFHDRTHVFRGKKRWNCHLQKWQYHVLTITSVIHRDEKEGWHRLLRYFSESDISPPDPLKDSSWISLRSKMDTGQYTKRRTIKLVRRWR
jgi:hypothetical protein